MFPAWVSGALKRYSTHCSTQESFDTVCAQFKQQLAARAYPAEIYDNALASLPTRTALLDTIIHPKAKNREQQQRPPGLHLRFPRNVTNDQGIPAFTVIKQQLKKFPPNILHSTEWRERFGENLPILQLKNQPNVGQYVTRSTF